MPKDSFIFYRSFYEAMQALNDKDRLKVYDAIAEKALNNKDVQLSGLSNSMFTLIKPQIEANNKKYENGKKGGRPRKENQNETTGFENQKPNQNQKETTGFENQKPNQNQNETETKANVNAECIMKMNNENENEKCRMQNEEKLQQLFIECLNSYNTFAIEECISFLDNLPCEVIEEALKKGGRIKQPNWGYCKKILDDWVLKGYKTLADIQDENINKNSTEDRIREALYGR